MAIYTEAVVETLCCKKQLPLSRTEISLWSLGGIVFTSHRCPDSPECEALELENWRDIAASLIKRCQS